MPKILLVEDNEMNRDMLSRRLQRQGMEVVIAVDGEQGVQLAQKEAPNLILMDIGMPRMNGYDAARRIREQPWGRAIMLVALTGWGLEEDKRLAAEAGFDRHVVKPVEASTLREILASVVA